MKICSAVLLPALKPACSSAMILLRLLSVQYDIQYDLAWEAYEADRLVVPAPLQVAFLGKCREQGLDP